MIRILRTRPQPLTGKASKDPAFPEHQEPFGKSPFRVAPHLISGTISCKSAIIDCIGIDTSAIFKGGVIMRLATYVYNDKEQLGVVSENGDSMVSLDGLCPNSSMAELIRNFSPEMAERIEAIRAEGETIPLNKIVLDSPLPNPPRGIICLGKNYRDHIKEVAKAIDGESEVPEFPIYFSKLVDRSVGTGGIIPSHEGLTDCLDYEVELAIIIGKEGRDIPRDQVEEHIFGYTIINDISVRDVQRKHLQWFRGKSFDGSSPMGPFIVTKEELKFPLELDIKAFVNGEMRQDSNTRELIYDIPRIISEFSMGITLKPGDVIATGTPAGVGMGFTPPRYLKSGDQVDCYIEGIGYLRNTVG